MSDDANPKGIPPTELARQQIFHMLKRISSYTAWNRLLGYYKKWLDATEEGLKMASRMGLENKTELDESEYVTVLKGYAHFDEGVRRLRQGDKRVFQYNAHGEFTIGLRIFGHWHKLFRYIESGDSIVDTKNTPLWPEFVKAFNTFGSALSECSPDIRERQWLDTESQTFYNEWLENALSEMTFPAPLPPVPNPPEHVLVPTGKRIPCSGIWEPVVAPPQAKSWSLFKKPPPTTGPLPIEGTMAYLHGGSDAPPKSDVGPDGVPSTWRLLWKDDRYEDGTIPEEEQFYVFRLPKPEVQQPAAPVPPARSDLAVLPSGAKTPVAGRWLLEGELDVAISLDKDQELPLHEGHAVRWVLAVA